MVLQWVHGPRTVVINHAGPHRIEHDGASMGPRSENRGYYLPPMSSNSSARASMGPRSENRGYSPYGHKEERQSRLQWVHGPRTVVIRFQGGEEARRQGRFNGSTVREPWLFRSQVVERIAEVLLQWVHGPRTVVIIFPLRRGNQRMKASMGPRSENRGYFPPRACRRCRRFCFNGSTVREPWLF